MASASPAVLGLTAQLGSLSISKAHATESKTNSRRSASSVPYTAATASSSSASSSSSSSSVGAFHGLRSAAAALPLRIGSSSAPSDVSGDFRAAVSAAISRAGSSLANGGVVTMGHLEAGVGIMGTKMGMMTYFTPEGNAIAVTVVGFHEGNVVTQVKTPATDGYSAVQVGYRRVRDTKLTMPEIGHLKKVDAIPMRHLQEFKLLSVDGFEPGQRLKVDELFKAGDFVDVAGNSIGKGFAGGIKRWHFARGQRTHGSKSYRQLGSIGAGTTPGRVYPGKKMPGRLGGGKNKIKRLQILKVDDEMHAMLIKGALPGKSGNLLRITPAKIVGKNIP